MGSLEAKRRKKKRKTHQNSSKVPPSATGTLSSRKTEPALCHLPLSWWDTAPAGALCWSGTAPSLGGHIPLFHHGGSHSRAHKWKSLSCGTGAELVSWGRNGTGPTARAGV